MRDPVFLESAETSQIAFWLASLHVKVNHVRYLQIECAP